MSQPQRPTDIPGYVHPQGTNTNRDSVYKTFTEGDKTREFGTTSVGKNYASYGDVVSVENKCPKCDQEAVTTCNCVYGDMKCKNQHVWYTDRRGNVKIGNPHKN